MLKIITALPGGGKTTQIYELLRSALEKEKNTSPRQMYLTDTGENRDLSRPIIIVPEQFHFETEHILYKKLGAGLIGGVEITSFTKLSREINSFYGKNKPYADRTVREITMFRTLTRLSGEKALVHYTGFHSKPAAAMQILTVIENFQKEGYSPSELENLYNENDADKSNLRLWRKMSDLINIYKLYSESLNFEYADRQDDCVRAAELSLLCGYFREREIFLDGFDGFSGSQFKLLNAAIRDCGNITISLLADKIPTQNDVYKTSALLYGKLKQAAKKQGKKTEIINLSVIKKGGFNPRSPEIFPAVTAPDVYKECEYTAAKIRELVTKHNYRYNDIAVITNDRSLTLVLNSALKIYDISAFLDIPSPIIEKPVVRFIIAALEAVSLKPEKLMIYIKSGFVRINPKFSLLSPEKAKNLKTAKLAAACENVDKPKKEASLKTVRLSRTQISRLEKAAIKYRLGAREWKNKFPDQNPLLCSLEQTRKAVIEPLLEFGKKLKNTTGDKITEALSDFLINKLEVPRTLLGIINKRSAAFKKGFQIDRSLNDEYRQLWETVISILEAMHAALYDYSISVEDYTSILVSVLGKTEIAKPPQVMDAVTVGDPLRTRAEGIKVALILGVNQGVFPKSTKSDGEFSADETDELLKAGVEIYENRTDRYYREKFIVNKTLFCPSERLHLSASLRGISWNAVEPSPLLKEVCGKIISTSELPVSFWASTPKAALGVLALAIGADKPDVQKAVYNALQSTDEIEVKEKTTLFEEARQKRLNGDNSHLHKINEETAVKLMRVESFSPSGIELLSSCGFKYFCERGLKIKPLIIENENTLNRFQRGNLIHYCLYKALIEYRDNDNFKKFTSLEPAQLEGLAERYINEFRETELLAGFAETVRKNKILMSYKPRIALLLENLRRETEVSVFKPYALEENISYSLNGLNIAGKTDRYDIYEDGNQIFVRVADYKTGKNVFNYNTLYHGLGLQALLYLFGIIEKNPHWVPAGAFYYSENIGYKTPAVIPDYAETENQDYDYEREAVRAWLDCHKHSGIVFGDENDLVKVENAAKNAAGFPESRKKFIERHCLSREDYDVLKSYTAKLLKKKVNSVLSGRVYALPVRDSAKNPCEYCEYDMCGNNGKAVKAESGDTNKIFNVAKHISEN